MTDQKEKELKPKKPVVVVNRGSRTFTLKDGQDKEGKPMKRILGPGQSIETLDTHEADHLLGYEREVVDASKAVPAFTDRVNALEAEIEKRNARIAELEAEVAMYEEDAKKHKK